MPKIQLIKCHKNLNSRGDWTIDTVIHLDDGTVVSQTVPEGASKGELEAISIPVGTAVEIVSHAINDALVGEDAEDQEKIDRILIDMDGTPNKQHLGGNSMLSVSLGVAKAVAESRKLELYEHLAFLYSGRVPDTSFLKFPTPLFNVINGGKHASNGLSFQEFMVIPSTSKTIVEALEMGTSVYKTLKKNLEEKGFSTGVGDEGGFAPEGLTLPRALELIKSAAGENFVVGTDIFFGLDAAAESFHHQDKYVIPEESLELEPSQLNDYYEKILNEYEIIYLEDPFYERDYKGWVDAYSRFSKKIMLVADDLVVTNANLLEATISKKMANSVIVKPNQVGTLSETFDFIRLARNNKMSIIVSHRSGDTAEDSFIADLAIAVEADFLKAGSPVRGERVVKYNRLLDIYSDING